MKDCRVFPAHGLRPEELDFLPEATQHLLAVVVHLREAWRTARKDKLAIQGAIRALLNGYPLLREHGTLAMRVLLHGLSPHRRGRVPAQTTRMLRAVKP